jgi:hypothetical protein
MSLDLSDEEAARRARRRERSGVPGFTMRSTPTPNWYRPGVLAIGAARPGLSLSAIYRGGWLIAYRSPVMDTGHILKPSRLALVPMSITPSL